MLLNMVSMRSEHEKEGEKGEGPIGGSRTLVSHLVQSRCHNNIIITTSVLYFGTIGY